MPENMTLGPLVRLMLSAFGNPLKGAAANCETCGYASGQKGSQYQGDMFLHDFSSQSSANSSWGCAGKSARFVGIAFLVTSKLPRPCDFLASEKPQLMPPSPPYVCSLSFQVAKYILKVFVFHPELAVKGQLVRLKNDESPLLTDT